MLSGISWPQLLIVLVIVLAIFGTKAMSDAEEAKGELSDDSGEDADFENTPVEENRKDS
jgi:Sec-independent protein translocase protein TatA